MQQVLHLQLCCLGATRSHLVQVGAGQVCVLCDCLLGQTCLLQQLLHCCQPAILGVHLQAPPQQTLLGKLGHVCTMHV